MSKVFSWEYFSFLKIDEAAAYKMLRTLVLIGLFATAHAEWGADDKDSMKGEESKEGSDGEGYDDSKEGLMGMNPVMDFSSLPFGGMGPMGMGPMGMGPMGMGPMGMGPMGYGKGPMMGYGKGPMMGFGMKGPMGFGGYGGMKGYGMFGGGNPMLAGAMYQGHNIGAKNPLNFVANAAMQGNFNPMKHLGFGGFDGLNPHGMQEINQHRYDNQMSEIDPDDLDFDGVPDHLTATKHKIDEFIAKQWKLGKRKLTVSANFHSIPLEYQYLGKFHGFPNPIAGMDLGQKYGATSSRNHYNNPMNKGFKTLPGGGLAGGMAPPAAGHGFIGYGYNAPQINPYLPVHQQQQPFASHQPPRMHHNQPWQQGRHMTQRHMSMQQHQPNRMGMQQQQMGQHNQMGMQPHQMGMQQQMGQPNQMGMQHQMGQPNQMGMQHQMGQSNQRWQQTMGQPSQQWQHQSTGQAPEQAVYTPPEASLPTGAAANSQQQHQQPQQLTK